MPLLLWVAVGSASVAAVGWGTDKAADGLVKGAVAGAVLFYVWKKI